MTDILDKIFTHRTAVAQAIVKVGNQDTIDTVKNKKVPKGDVFEFSRAAGLFAVKKTSDMIPDCHPLPVEHCKISFEMVDLEIRIRVEVATIYKTGVEVEAMHGAAITALTIYDMLKPLDKSIEILSIKLLEKSGGKSDFYDKINRELKTALVVCSDTVFNQKKEDKAGKAVIKILEKYQLKDIFYTIIPDEKEMIQSTLRSTVDEKYDLLLFVGGTGLSPRDITPESVAEMLEREIPGIMEAARNYGQQRTPYAMLSRGVAGYIGKTLVITLPGSTKGAVETVQAVFPALFHVFKVAAGERHGD